MKRVVCYALMASFLALQMSSGPALMDKRPEAQTTFKVSVPPVTNTLFGLPVEGHLVIEDQVKRNQFLADILRQYNVQAHLIRQASTLPREVFDVRKIVPQKKITLICRNDSLRTPRALVYEPNPIEYVVFNLGENLTVETCRREVKVTEREISGVIESSLFQTIASMGITYELTNKVVDILAWQVDFQRLNKGDEIKIIYEEMQVEGKSIGIGQIKGIYFRYGQKEVYAIPFNQGEGLEYFDENGNSLRKALLKYPIEFTRISSRYSMRRFHPVLKVNRPHLGTDFAAPTGTPVRSVGDGVVVEATYTANNGNYVKIRHNSTYTTQYLHLSKIAPGIKAGVSVKQGQWIGNVGSTGLATGPHLCYRFWKNGVQIDALKAELPSALPIHPKHREAFNQVKEATIKRLDAIPAAVPAFYAAAY
jgi:murein DD-endopeptidase MepM/ murein hydrolase activator NlpD